MFLFSLRWIVVIVWSRVEFKTSHKVLLTFSENSHHLNPELNIPHRQAGYFINFSCFIPSIFYDVEGNKTFKQMRLCIASEDGLTWKGTNLRIVWKRIQQIRWLEKLLEAIFRNAWPTVSVDEPDKYLQFWLATRDRVPESTYQYCSMAPPDIDRFSCADRRAPLVWSFYQKSHTVGSRYSEAKRFQSIHG